MAENSQNKCSHKDKWQVAGSSTADLGKGVLLLLTTLYCTGCGEIKVKAEKVKVQ
jgi:hypothetical protein